MTDEEIEKLAKAVSERMQKDVMNNIYHDAGKNLFGLLKSLFYGALVLLAAWGASTNIGGGK